jgi:hypothetical protein
MGHFAKIVNNRAVQIITLEEDKTGSLPPGNWLQTSYNTRGGIHICQITATHSLDQSSSLRYNFAGTHPNYDPVGDAFYEDQPFDSWILNTGSYEWEPPTGWPTPGWPDDVIVGYYYHWIEETQEWVSGSGASPY